MARSSTRSSTLSRRASEVLGVVLFAAALIWLVSLASYNPTDPVWFFSVGSRAVPANFAGRVGAFLAELSIQLFGYASYTIPVLLAFVGWHFFWCSRVDAAGTKALGATVFFGCLSALLSLALGAVPVAGRTFRAGGYLGDWLETALTGSLNRTGSLIVLLTLIFLAVILATQVSLGRLFASLADSIRAACLRVIDAVHELRDERRRNLQRKEVLAKHAKRAKAADKAGEQAAAIAAGAAAEAPVRASRRREKAQDVPPEPVPSPDPAPVARAARPPKSAPIRG